MYTMVFPFGNPDDKDKRKNIDRLMTPFEFREVIREEAPELYGVLRSLRATLERSPSHAMMKGLAGDDLEYAIDTALDSYGAVAEPDEWMHDTLVMLAGHRDHIRHIRDDVDEETRRRIEEFIDRRYPQVKDYIDWKVAELARREAEHETQSKRYGRIAKWATSVGMVGIGVTTASHYMHNEALLYTGLGIDLLASGVVLAAGAEAKAKRRLEAYWDGLRGFGENVVDGTRRVFEPVAEGFASLPTFTLSAAKRKGRGHYRNGRKPS